MKIVRCFVVFVVLLFSLPRSVYAIYVLPYPSYMPGNKMYKVSRVVDVARGWWSWGTIASLKYHLALADKYLVEAKILFEYKQYPFALDALARSDAHVVQLDPMLAQGTREGKDMSRFAATVDEAMVVHKAVLFSLIEVTPATFLWQPEKAVETNLLLHESLKKSYEIR